MIDHHLKNWEFARWHCGLRLMHLASAIYLTFELTHRHSSIRTRTIPDLIARRKCETKLIWVMPVVSIMVPQRGFPGWQPRIRCILIQIPESRVRSYATGCTIRKIRSASADPRPIPVERLEWVLPEARARSGHGLGWVKNSTQCSGRGQGSKKVSHVLTTSSCISLSVWIWASTAPWAAHSSQALAQLTHTVPFLA